MGRIRHSNARTYTKTETGFLCLGCLTFLSFLLIPSALMARRNGGIVTGEIRLPDGSPASGIRVSAMSANGAATDAVVFLESLAETDLSGRYRLSAISPGRYYIVAGALDAPTYYPGVDSTRDARVLEIADGSSVGSVDFTVQRLRGLPPSPVRSVPLGIPGKVVLEGGKRLPGFLPRLYVDAGKGTRRATKGEDGIRIRGSGTYGAVAVSRDGSFQLLVDDGDYDISLITSLGDPLTAADDGYYVKSIVSGSVDLSKQKLAVRGRTAPAITITLAAGVRPVR
jgi:hypothetical protein